MAFKFFGGVHPNENKKSTNACPSTPSAPPAQVVIPMSLHIGTPCQPTVAVGDYVKLGQKIGDTDAPIAAPVHASVSGKVVAVEPRLHANGTKVNSVVIENDGEDTLCETILPRSEAEVAALSGEEITAIIRDCGVVGMGGATFPTAFKITSGKGKVNTLVINGAECEPYITSDHRTMLEHPDEVLSGIRLLMRACGVEKASVGIETNKADAIALLRSKKPEKMGITIVPMRCRYPQGAEKQLIQTVTGREVPPGGLPADVGCAVFNVFTAYCVHRAVYENYPAVERVVTVAGSAVQRPMNLIVRIGTPLEHVFSLAGGFKKPPKKVLMGGPMMGNAMFDLSVGTLKATNALLAFCEDEDQTLEDPTCIRCGRCTEVCPMRLLPLYMYMYERRSDYAMMEKYRITDCIECGACTYICPGRLHLTHAFRTGKAKLRAKAAEDKARAEEAKMQSEASEAAAGKEAGKNE